MKKKSYNKKLLFLFFITLAILFLGAYFCIKELSLIKVQRNIYLTPEDIIKIFQNSELKVYGIEYYEHGVKFSGPISPDSVVYAYHCNVEINTIEYRLNLILNNSWKEARNLARYINRLDNQMNGNLAYSIYYGPVVINISPSDKNIGNFLYDLISSVK